MKNKFFKPFLLLTLALNFSGALAQKKDENIGTEVVNVVKPYSATISDAFKVKETPSLEDDENTKMENIQYTIFSFPVASTFTPAKGRAANVDKTKKEKLYSNYASLGFGNYGRILGELFVTEKISNSDYFGTMLRHHSSQGGIENLILDDKFYNTSLDATYGSMQKHMTWTADIGYQHQMYNWYGLNQDYFANTLDFFANKDVAQTYHNFYLGGSISFAESFFTGAQIKFNRFWDAYGSAENRFVAQPSFAFDLMDTQIKTDVSLDYVSGSFDKNYFDGPAISYGFANFGLSPSFNYSKDDLSLNVGVSLFYSSDLENSDSKFFIYPNISASYKVVGDLMIMYAGAEGRLNQNTYRDFTNENPFLSPTLFIKPTSTPYDVFVGLKGKLASTVSYNLSASYSMENDKAMFVSNAKPGETLPFLDAVSEQYQYGNSFSVFYDDVRTLGVFGEVKADITPNFSLGLNGTINSFSPKNNEEVLNLPALKMGAFTDFSFTEKWYAGMHLFFVGERDDYETIVLSNDVTNFTRSKITLDSYLDFNAHVGYKHNERLTLFLKGNNLFNQAYERWNNFPTQQIQVVLGANYKFDF